MKKHLFIVLPALIALNCSAQIVLTTADLPQVGDIYIMRKNGPTSTSPGPSGAGQMWNFSSLTGSPDTLWYIDPSTTPNGASFPTSNLCVKHASEDGHFDYYQNNSGGTQLVGFDGNMGVVTLLQQGYEFPLMGYGSSMTQHFRAKVNVTSATTYDVIHLVHNTTVDGWGTITTPAGTASVLRVYTTETGYDSSYVSGVGTQTDVSTGYYYKWYAKGLGWPVLEIAQGRLRDPDLEQTIYAHDLSGITGVGEWQEENVQVNVYPNPFNGSFTLQSVERLNNATISIFDCAGKQVYGQAQLSGDRNVIETGELDSGAYYYQLISTEGAIMATGKLLVE